VSVLFVGGVGAAYLVIAIGLHRLNLRRLRLASGGFRTLHWLDWDSLLEGLLPAGPGDAGAPCPAALGGGPAPAVLSTLPAKGAEPRHALLRALVAGHSLEAAALETAGFSGGEATWLHTLSLVAGEPEQAIERLLLTEPESAAQVYLRERLLLGHRTHSFNLELAVFASKRRLGRALVRFGDQPPLYFARALASSLVGLNNAAIDDLARAVYFSRQSNFYLRAVVETPLIDETRPALARQCRLLFYPSPEVG
jgi:hypothetical protein